MDQQVTTAASAVGPPPEDLPAVHTLRFGIAPDDPLAVRILDQPSSLPEGTTRVVVRSAASVAGAPLDAPALAFSHLPDGGSVLYRTTAAGAGEFEVEVMLYPDDDRRDGWLPIDAWPEEAWPRRGAGPGRFRPVLWGERADLVTFARRMAAVLPSVLADVRSLFATEAGPQIFLTDEREDVACWIMLASASLPPTQARALTFTTSAGLPHAVGQQIAGISPDAVDRLSDEEVEFLYRVRGRHGRTSPDLPDPWARVAAALWIAGRPELIVDGVGRPAAGVGFGYDPDTADGAEISKEPQSEGSRIPTDEPFNAGRLAAVAMLAGVDVEPDLKILAVTWLSRYASTSSMAQSAIAALLQALPPIARDAVNAPQPDRKVVLRFLGEAFRSLKRRDRQTARPIAVKLGSVVVDAALVDVADIVADPLAELELTDTERSELSMAYVSRIRKLFDDDGETFPPRQLYGSVVLARALGIGAAAGLERLTGGLCRRLLAPQPGADQGKVLAYLDGTGDRELTERVVAHLEEQLHRRGDVDRFRDLAIHETGEWLRHQDLAKAPALDLLLAATSPRMRALNGMDRFTELFQQSKRREVRMLRIMGDLSWQVTGKLSVADALRLGKVLGASDLLDTGFDGRLTEAFDPARCVGTTDVQELTELAKLLRRHDFRLSAKNEAIAELLIDSDALTPTAPFDQTVQVVRRMASLDLPAPIRDRTAKITARIFSGAKGQDLLNPSTADTFIDQSSGTFLRAYVDLHQRGQTVPVIRNLIRDSDNAAGRYYLWLQMEKSDQPDMRRYGADLIRDFIAPARLESSRRWENAVHKALKRDHPNTADVWHRSDADSEPPASRDERPTHQHTTDQQGPHQEHDPSPQQRSDTTRDPAAGRGPAGAGED
ncbi:GAP1-M domain-containing protein [Catenulispora rubra]|uniref:GAP1-M domain-containing protein n=1 Tax=Catenulispora rubra TaxID=280293 RepID=UPI0018925917|nr:hypothetical protein [Catenulispora rubra]